MFKKIKILMIAFVVLVGGVLSTSFNSSAFGYEAKYNCAMPSTGDGMGYIVLIYHNGSNYGSVIYAWNVIVSAESGNDVDTLAYVELGSNSMRIGPFTSGNASGGFISVLKIFENGEMRPQWHSDSSPYVVNFGFDVVGYKIYGDGFIYSSSIINQNSWTVSFEGGESSSVVSDIFNLLLTMKDGSSLSELSDKLTLLENEISQLNSNVENIQDILDSYYGYYEDIVSWLDSIYRVLDLELENIQLQLNDIDSKLTNIYSRLCKIEEQLKKSNTWLEKIYNFFVEKDEKDKEQAQTQGNTSISQGTASIEDKGTGFVASMGGLVSSMSYSGTECAWTFPQVKLPAIDGVMEERVLIEEQPIDFTRWINAIPAPILLLIQSVLTMGLIVYCFKELYGTISYVLTLRGGGSNE